MRAVADDYLGRIRRYARCDEIEVKDDRALQKPMPADSLVVALEVLGDSVTSTELAQRVERWTSTGKGDVTFVIGGADGIPDELSRRANARLSLLELTLPHRLARVLLARAALSLAQHSPRRAVRPRRLSPAHVALRRTARPTSRLRPLSLLPQKAQATPMLKPVQADQGHRQ